MSGLDAKVEEQRRGWEKEQRPNHFSKPEFTDLRHLVAEAAAFDDLAEDNRRWMMQGCLFDGYLPSEFTPPAEATWAVTACDYWLNRQGYRGPRYRAAALLQHLGTASREQVLSRFTDKSPWRNAPALADAIRGQHVLHFLSNSDLADDLMVNSPDDQRRKREIIRFVEQLNFYYAAYAQDPESTDSDHPEARSR